MNLLKSGGIIDEPINENLHFLKHPNIQDFSLINFNILGNIIIMDSIFFQFCKYFKIYQGLMLDWGGQLATLR